MLLTTRTTVILYLAISCSISAVLASLSRPLLQGNQEVIRESSGGSPRGEESSVAEVRQFHYPTRSEHKASRDKPAVNVELEHESNSDEESDTEDLETASIVEPTESSLDSSSVVDSLPEPRPSKVPRIFKSKPTPLERAATFVNQVSHHIVPELVFRDFVDMNFAGDSEQADQIFDALVNPLRIRTSSPSLNLEIEEIFAELRQAAIYIAFTANFSNSAFSATNEVVRGNYNRDLSHLELIFKTRYSSDSERILILQDVKLNIGVINAHQKRMLASIAATSMGASSFLGLSMDKLRAAASRVPNLASPGPYIQDVPPSEVESFRSLYAEVFGEVQGTTIMYKDTFLQAGRSTNRKLSSISQLRRLLRNDIRSIEREMRDDE